MGVFSFIETFFFISLAITFILILLLVNHFKQRLTVLENKCDSLYEIINSNLLKELNSFKSSMESGLHFRNNHIHTHTPDIMQLAQEQHFISKSMPEYIMENIETTNSQNDKIVVSDNDEDDDERDNDSESDSESDKSSASIMYTGEEYEDINSDNDDNNDSDIVTDENIAVNNSIIMNVEDSESKIKIVNVDIQESLQMDSINNDYDNTETDSVNLEEITEVPELSTENKTEIHVEKILDTIDGPEEIVNEPSIESNKDIYLKMNVNELRKVVITKGLCSDASKLKRNDLMKLLEVI